MRIIIDAMGGDNAPLEIIRGTVDAARECRAELTLVGNKELILKTAEENGLDISCFDTVHSESVITMEDDPIIAIQRKKDSSMAMGLRLLASGEGDAFVSAGNTGALFSGASIIAKKAKGVGRAAIGTVLPGTVPCLLLDAGANVSVTEEYLEQFAVMGSAYMRKMYGIDSPKVGLLNNGTEDCKGTALQIAANRCLRENSYINYVGNVEGSAALFGTCDVLICDGYTGNIFLKAIEGMGKRILSSLRDVYSKNIISKLSYLIVKKPFGKMKKAFDPKEHGGSPILGLSKPVIKAHGSSDAKAFKNAIFQAVRFTESGAIGDIAAAAEKFAENLKTRQ